MYFWAIATNIPQRLKTVFLPQGRIYTQKVSSFVEDATFDHFKKCLSITSTDEHIDFYLNYPSVG